MAKRTSPGRRTSAKNDFDKASKADFKERLKQFAKQHGSIVGEDNSLKQEDFDGWEDLEDYVRHRGKAVTVDFQPKDMPRRSTAKPRRRPPPPVD